jgi:hypothetical protein
MVVAQIGGMFSLHETETQFKLLGDKINHLGISNRPTKSTLSYQNDHRNCELFVRIYYLLFD